MRSALKDKVILVTGGTGSFGHAFVQTALTHKPKAIRIYSRGELLQFLMEQDFNDDRLRFFIGDVRDSERLCRAMTDVDIVIHAAALKQVPGCEYNPTEAIKTNIDGAINIVNCAVDQQVEKVIAISTDKSVHPVNLYGMTKAVMEKLLIQANIYSKNISHPTNNHAPIFSCVRYGNVLGSRGSVVPLFQRQREDGLVTITDRHMTRFWITLEQGVELVINGLESMKGGEVFVPKAPSMKVTEVARAIAPHAEFKIVGIRPGEKVHEILITAEEAKRTIEAENMFTILPEFPFSWKSHPDKEAKFRAQYDSLNNTWYLTANELVDMIEESGRNGIGSY